MFCLIVLPNVLPKCSADRCADGATTEGTVLAAAPLPRCSSSLLTHKRRGFTGRVHRGGSPAGFTGGGDEHACTTTAPRRVCSWWWVHRPRVPSQWLQPQSPQQPLGPAAPQALTVTAQSLQPPRRPHSPQTPHSGCSPRALSSPWALQPSKPSQSLHSRCSPPGALTVPRPLTVAAAPEPSAALGPPLQPHSRCTVVAQSLQPPGPHTLQVPLTVAAASRASLLTPDPREWVRIEAETTSARRPAVGVRAGRDERGQDTGKDTDATHPACAPPDTTRA